MAQHSLRGKAQGGIIWAIVLCLVAGVAAAGADPPVGGPDADRAALLRGVTGVVAPGGVPGDVVAFGDRAFVLLTGRMGKAALPVFAAAHAGKGRLVIGGHEAFFGGAALQHADNRTLAGNIAAWAGDKPLAGLRVSLVGQAPALRQTLAALGCRPEDRRVEQLPDTLASTDVLWLNQASLDGVGSRQRVEAVCRWMEGGGGLVITGPGWGWQSVNPGRELSRDQSGNQLAQPFGLAFGGGSLEQTGGNGFTSASVSLASAAEALGALEEQAAGRRTLSAAELDQASVVLSEALAALPADPSGFPGRVAKLCADKGGAIPTRQAPITQAMPFARLKVVLDAQGYRHESPDEVAADPSAATFPGPVPATAKRETRTVSIDTRVPAWHGTGLYAPPGEVVTVTVPADAAGKGLSVRIGCHTDTLWQLARWERFPEITMRRPLTGASLRVASPFGGSIYVEVPERCVLGVVSVTLANAVAAPRFVRGVTSVVEWKQTLRNAPAPWAELEGKLVILSVPSYAVRDLDDPEALLAYWDEVMEHCYSFFAAPKRSRPERYCVDRQISAGYMHSGYPIMTGEDVARTFCDLKVLRGSAGSRCWGFYHEMGHNFQKPEWTWRAFGEVSNNLFSLYGTETLNGVKVGGHPAMTAAEMAKREQAVSAAPGKEQYFEKDPWYPLTMFWLMRRDFGWEPFTRLFAEFRDLPAADRPHTEAEKHDQFLTRFSRLTGHNLTAYLSAWGVETSPRAKETVANLPPWMPPDWTH